MTYTYQARDGNGNSVAGETQAADELAALLTLGDRDLTVVSLQSSVGRKIHRQPVTSRVLAQDLVIFTRLLATMLDAGLPLLEALTSLKEQTSSKKLTRVLKQITNQVEQGEALSQALGQHPKVFNEMYINLVQTGEAAGMLAEILARLATELEASARLARKVKSAMTYPVVVSFIAFCIALFLILKIVPQFVSIFKDLGGQLPAPTRVLIQISNVLKHDLLYVIAGAGLVAYVLWRLKRTPWGIQHWDRLKLRLPVAGRVAKKITLARFARTFSTLTHSGVPILQTLRIAGRATGNSAFEAAATGMIEAVENGDSLAVAMAKYPVFPPILVRMVAVGEQTSRVDVMLGKLAEFYSEEVEATLASLTSIIEPLLIVCIGLVVGSIVICLFLPIFRMSEAIQ